MAFGMAILRCALENKGCTLSFLRWTHSIAINNHTIVSPPLVLPELDQTTGNGNIGFGFPSFTFGGGSMELMAVPKKKVSPHKRGIRNGPRALKPIPVIIRCKGCGRIKLPHFYCCSGDRGNTGGQNDQNG